MHQSFLIIRSRGGVYAARRVRFIGLTRAQLQMLRWWQELVGLVAWESTRACATRR